MLLLLLLLLLSNIPHNSHSGIPGQAAPPRLVLKDSWSVTAGGNITLVCRAYSAIGAVVFWTKDQNITRYTKVLQGESARRRGEYTSILTIINASSEDAGVYNCNAKNGVGHVVQKTSRLTVITEKGKVAAGDVFGVKKYITCFRVI